MKTFQTPTASWTLKDGKWSITQYKGTQVQGKIELLPEDMAQAVEQLAALAKKEQNNG